MCEEFLLKWNDYQTSFSAMMKSICLKEEMTDCTISNGSKSFYAHRMVLSTCSPYLRTLFSSIPANQYPVIFIKDIEDCIVELLVRYMYSGEISVAEDQIIPLVHAAKSLAIKGLLDVPVPGSGQDDQLKPPPTKKAKIKHKTAPTPVPGLLASPCDSKATLEGWSDDRTPPTKDKEHASPKNASKQSRTSGSNDGDGGIAIKDIEELTSENPGSFDGLKDTFPVVSLEDEMSPDEEDAEFKNQHELLQRLTSEMSAYPVLGCSAPLTVYACQHCGKEFSSKRKHQRHVLNVHFGYNPVQCPFCEKGHRDNYNLKQHVCPVLNMKYGNFKTKDNAGINNNT